MLHDMPSTMAYFSPGQLKQKLQDKIRAGEDSSDEEELAPVPIKKTTPNSFAPNPALYASEQMKAIHNSVQGPKAASSLPKESIMNKPVHERMKAFVKQQYGK